MKKMTFIQKLKFVFQNMKIEYYTILAYLFVALLIFGACCGLFNFKPSLLLYLIIVCIVFVIHFLAHIIESIGILLKGVKLIDGKICKTYNDYGHREDHGGTATYQLYTKKYVSLFSNKVKERRVPIPMFIRIKVQSNDDKYVSPWAPITKRVFKNKEKYSFMIIMYNNIPVAVYRETGK